MLVAAIVFVCFTTKSFADESTYTVYIDPGHGGMDGGATIGSIKESTITLQISKKIQEVFENNNIKAILTRETEDDLSTKEFVKREDMLKRVNMINTSKANLALSIHLNKFSIEKYRGAQVFYSQTNPNNLLLAETMQRNLISYLKNTDRKIVKRDNVFLLNRVTIPCCIIECGFMSNPTEFDLLQSDDYQYKIACALLLGVKEFLLDY